MQPSSALLVQIYNYLKQVILELKNLMDKFKALFGEFIWADTIGQNYINKLFYIYLQENF